MFKSHPHCLHQPLPFTGLRFSLVFFLSDLQGGDSAVKFTIPKIQDYINLGWPQRGLIDLGLLAAEASQGSKRSCEEPRSRKRSLSPDLAEAAFMRRASERIANARGVLCLLDQASEIDI